MVQRKWRCPICGERMETFRKLGFHVYYRHGDGKDKCPDYLKP